MKISRCGCVFSMSLAIIRSFTVISALLLATACGGGGGGGDGGNPGGTTAQNGAGDSPPSLSIATASIVEGDLETKDLLFRVRLSKAANDTVSVDYTTVDGSALSGADFDAASGRLSIPAGQMQADILIRVLGDSTIEGTETFTISLSNPSGATLATSSARGTIVDNDSSLPVVQLFGAQGNEGGYVIFRVAVTPAASEAITFNYQTNDISTTADSDYVAVNDTFTIPASTPSYVIRISTLRDSEVEYPEIFSLNLSNLSSNAVFGADGASAIGTINDRDLPIVSVMDGSVAEGDDGETRLEFRVVSSALAVGDLSVDYVVSGDTATEGADFSGSSGSAVIPAGSSFVILPVTIYGDFDIESDETLTVTISNLTGLGVLNVNGLTATGTITNDDNATDIFSSFAGEFVFNNSGCRSTDNLIMQGSLIVSNQSGSDFTAQAKFNMAKASGEYYVEVLELLGNIDNAGGISGTFSETLLRNNDVSNNDVSTNGEGTFTGNFTYPAKDMELSFTGSDSTGNSCAYTVTATLADVYRLPVPSLTENLMVSDASNTPPGEITPTGSMVQLSLDGEMNYLSYVDGSNAPLYRPSMLSLGPNRTLYAITETNSQLVRIQLDTGRFEKIGPYYNYMYSVRATDDGSVYAITPSSQGSAFEGILRYNSTDDSLEEYLTSSSLSNPLGFDIDADGFFVINDVLNVLKINPANGDTLILSSGGFLEEPRDLEIAPNGDIYLISNRIYPGMGSKLIRVDPIDGTQTLIAESSNPQYYHGLEFDELGHVLIARNGPYNSEILRLHRLTGEKLTIPPWLFSFTSPVQDVQDVVLEP